MTSLFLVGAYLRQRPLSNALYVLMLAAGVAAATALLLFSQQSGSRLARDAAGVDLVVGHKGSPLQLVMAAVFHADAPAGNVPFEAVARLAGDPRVAAAIPIGLGDSVGPFRIVGAPPDILGLYQARIADGAAYARPFEAVLGAETARRLGLGVGDTFVGSHGLGAGGHVHGDQPYQVVGVLARTGSVIDRLALTPLESVWALHGVAPGGREAGAHAPDHTPDHTHDHTHDHDHAHDEAHDQGRPEGSEGPASGSGEGPRFSAQGAPIRGAIEPLPPEATAILIQTRAPMGLLTLKREINAGTAMIAARPAEEATRLFELIGVGGRLLQAFAFLLIGAAALSVFTTLLSALTERRGEIALLRAMGATRGMVFAVLLGQGLVIAALGAGLGLVGGHVLIEALARMSPQAAGFGLTGFAFHPLEAMIALGAVAAGALAALPAALGAYRTPIAATLAEAG